MRQAQNQVTDVVIQVSQLTHLNDALLAQLDLPKMESFWFTAKDGTKLQGFLIRPPGFDPAKKYPVKFLIHGGPQGSLGRRLELPLEPRALCRQRLRGRHDQSRAARPATGRPSSTASTATGAASPSPT